MTIPEMPQAPSAPTCYRHADRETWVSCGRCGKPLCPDCVQHGPVGVRCWECLHPEHGPADLSLRAPVRVGTAALVACLQAVVWVGLLVALGVWTQTWSANVLLTGMAAGFTGWLIWRIVGRTWSRATARLALLLGIGIPLAAGALLALLWLIAGMPGAPFWLLGLRLLASAGIGALFGWLLGTQRRGL